MKELIQNLCALSGVSSREDEVRDYIRAQVTPWVDSVETDALGSLIVTKKGAVSAPGHLAIAAHIDEVGLMIDRIHSDGTLGFQFVGGVDRGVVIGKRVYIGEKKLPAVVGMKPIHLTTAEERKSFPKTKELYLDIGCTSKEEAAGLVQLGDVAVFDGEVTEFRPGLMKGKAMDDRVGCALLIRLLREELPLDVTAVFTVQEEVGARGALGAAFSRKTEKALILEATAAADYPAVDEGEQICRLGQGPVIPFMDKGTIYDKPMGDTLRRLAKDNGIPFQTKNVICGGTDAGAYQRRQGGTRAVGLAVPARYIHCPTSVTALEDCEQTYQLLRLFVQAEAREVTK